MGEHYNASTEHRHRKKRYKTVEKRFVMDFEKAWEIFDAPVQCGECYCFYDPKLHSNCPCCGSDEWVGNR